MGRFFIENEHLEYDDKQHFYCKSCKDYYNNNIEISSGNKCTEIEGETIKCSCLVFLDISFNNINFDTTHTLIELHPGTDSKFILFDLDPAIAGGLARQIFCNYCSILLGWVIIYHPKHPFYEKLFFMNKNNIF